MSKHSTIQHHVQEIDLFQRRAIISLGLVFLLLFLLIARLYYLQIHQQNLYSTLSKKNQLTFLPIPPNRGLIYDRNGLLIAQNIPIYNLVVIPEKVKNLQNQIAELGKIIPITQEQIEKFNKLNRQHRRFTAVPIRTKLNDNEVATFYVNQHKFPGFSIESQLVREYPQGKSIVDALGYVGRMNAYDLSKVDNSNYIATHYIGKVGIEKFYESILHGKVGYQQVETEASGRIVRVLKKSPPISGDDLYLTIDSKLQTIAKKSLGNFRGAVVAIEPSSGEILALVSNPTYDPNEFVKGMSSEHFKELQSSDNQPMFNRAIRGQYALASTIKPFLALEGLNSGITTPERKIYDPGWFKVKYNRHIYRDWKKNGHGHINLYNALIVSCDTYFYDLAYRLGIKHIDSIMHKFGFGEETKIDLGEELPGLIPSPTWKFNTQGLRWYPGDTILSGIGQGYMLATPLQLAHATSILANRGKRYQPHLLKQEKSITGDLIEQLPTPLPSVDISAKHYEYVISAMRQVIENPHGTGFRFGRAPYSVAAKTGTGQLVSTGSNQKSLSDIPERLRDNSIFIAFAPVEKPQIAIAVIVENNPYAPRVARSIVDYYLLGKGDATA